MPIDVTARHVFAYSGRQIQLADEHTLVFATGNALAFTSTVSHSQHFLLRAKPRQLVAFDCNWRTATFAVTAREPSAAILLYSYPDKKLRGKLQHGARFEYSRIAFSRCGRRLVSLRAMDPDERDESSTAPSGSSDAVAIIGSSQRLAPPSAAAATGSMSSISTDSDASMTATVKQDTLLAKRQCVCVWDIEQLEPVKGCANGLLTIDATFVSFDPTNPEQFVVGGDDGMQIWKLYCGKTASLLRHVSVHYDKFAHSVARDNATSDDDMEHFELDEKRGQWLCHAWLKNSRFLAANRAGELVIVDAATACVLQMIDTALQPTRRCISSIVYTLDATVLCYANGRVTWLGEKHWDVLQTSSLPDALPPAAAADGNGSDTGLIACMTPSPNHSKLYIGTRDGRIFELKSSVAVDDDDDDDESSGGAMATSPADAAGENAHLIVPCGNFPVGAALASAALTPAGGAFPADALVASGGASGRVYVWSIATCRLTADADIASLFAKTPDASSSLATSESSRSLTQSTASLGQSSNSQSAESLPPNGGGGESFMSPTVLITALASSPVDPVLVIGDHTGRLRVACVANVVGGNGAIELIPLHSMQLISGDNASLDTLVMHPTQPVVLAASTCANTVFFVSLDHEKRFQVLAYVTLPDATERVVDVQWSIPTHSANALSATCFSSRGLFYAVRFQPPAIMANTDVSIAAPTALTPRVVAFGDNVLPTCTSLRFLSAAPTSMMLAVAPTGNHVHVMKYMDGAATVSTTEKISVVSKVLAQDAHENGIATIALLEHPLADGSELVATAGMNGAITVWLVAFGAGGTADYTSASRTSDRNWQLEDVQAAKKKTVVVHAGAVTSLLFLCIDNDVVLVSTGTDGCVFLLDVRIPTEALLSSNTVATTSVRSMNPLYISIVSFAKYDAPFQPAQERECTPFLQLLRAAEALDARNRFDKRKDQTRGQLSDLEARLKALLAENSKLPETERLARDEFVVNVDWRDALLATHRERSDRVRESIERDVAKMNIVRERMRQEFWDSATVQGVRLRGLSPANATVQPASSCSSELFVYNFPMRRLSKQEIRLARKVELLRVIEYAHEQHETTELLSSSSGSATKNENARTRFHDVLAPTTSSLQWLINAGVHHPALNKWLVDKKSGGGAGASTTSASESDYSTLQPYELVYHPAAIYTRKQQRIQIHLLKMYVRALVTEFNAEFDALVRLKESKIDEIDAKNARILEISTELSSGGGDTAASASVAAAELFRPQLAPDERATSILDVTPDEMTQTVYESDESRAKREREALEKLELEKQRQKDDVAGRALRDMMDGTLEVKKETLAAQTLVKEPWMLETPVEEMTPEQRKLVAQFEAAQLKFADEQEKYRKSLDLELKKVRSEITDVCRAFDDKLRAMQESYLLMRRAVLVQQLYQLRLAEDLMAHEHLLLARARVATASRELQALIQTSERESDRFSVQLERAKDAWHRAVDDDKSCEKNFVRELEEMATMTLEHDTVKHVVELFKKRKGDDLVLHDGSDAFRRSGGASAKRGKSSKQLGMMGMSSMALPTGSSAKTKQRLLGDSAAFDASSRNLAAPVTTLLQSLQRSTSECVDGDENLDPFQYVDLQHLPSLRRLNSSISTTDGSSSNNSNPRHVVPLDYDVDRPDGVQIDERVWRALNTLRTKKIVAEHAVRDHAEQFARAKVVADELRLQLRALHVARQDHAAVDTATTQQLDARAANAPLLVHIKQGQDESSSSSIDTNELFQRLPSASAAAAIAPLSMRSTTTTTTTTANDAFLVARASVEALNDVIARHGKDQVGVLRQIQHFRKNINVMEWEHTLLRLQTHDMDERYTDMQLLRVTKELQELLHTGGDTSAKHKREAALLEAKLAHVGTHHQTNMLKLEQAMRKLARQHAERLRENDGFAHQAATLQMQVQIREDILASRKSAALRSAAAVSSSNSSSNSSNSLNEQEHPQLRAILVRRKLVDLAKSQTDEIECLRLELDKMRRRTFPSFVQHHAAREYQASDTR